MLYVKWYYHISWIKMLSLRTFTFSIQSLIICSLQHCQNLHKNKKDKHTEDGSSKRTHTRTHTQTHRGWLQFMQAPYSKPERWQVWFVFLVLFSKKKKKSEKLRNGILLVDFYFRLGGVSTGILHKSISGSKELIKNRQAGLFSTAELVEKMCSLPRRHE